MYINAPSQQKILQLKTLLSTNITKTAFILNYLTTIYLIHNFEYFFLFGKVLNNCARLSNYFCSFKSVTLRQVTVKNHNTVMLFSIPWIKMQKLNCTFIHHYVITEFMKMKALCSSQHPTLCYQAFDEILAMS